MRKLFLALSLPIVLLLGLSAISAPEAQSVVKGTLLLTEQNTVNFRGVVNEQSTTAVTLALIEKVKTRGNKSYPIYLVMDSPGGSIIDGIQFIEFLESLENVQTITLFAASMASAIVEGNPGRRYITKNGILMFHRARGGFEGQFEEGEVEQQLALWKQIVRGMEQANANRMGMPLETYKAKVMNELWIYGNDNITQNAADEMTAIKCTDGLIDTREIGSVESMFGNLSATFSGCPLLRGPVAYSNNIDEE